MNQQESGLSFERVVFFSDAVFAIVITLLVLEIKTPHLDVMNDVTLNYALLHLVPKVIGFVVSFVIIGLMWIEHHRIFSYINAYDIGLLWRNLLMLLCVSFVPFPTALFSEYYWSRTAFILYTASFGFVGLTKLWIWAYASGKGKLVASGIDDLHIKRIKRRSLAVPLACGVAIALSLISIRIAPLGFALIPLIAYLLDPSRGSAKKKNSGEAPDEEAAT